MKTTVYNDQLCWLRRFTFRFILFGSCLIGSAQYSLAQMSAHKGQALFIYNFTKYVKWPNQASNLVIGVLGDSEMLAEMNASLKGKKAGESILEIRKVTSVTEAAQCNLVYVPSSRSKDLENLINAVQEKGVLVVSEEDMADKGASISFLLVESKLRFKINAQTIKKSGLQVSSSLLSLAVTM